MNGELKNLAFLKPPFFWLQVKNNNTNPCFIQEVSDYNCVYRNEVHHTAGERTQVLQDVASDPTLPRTKTVRCALCGHGEAVFFQVFFFLFCLVSFSWPSFPCDAIWMTWSIKQYAKILQFVNVTVGCCIPLCFFCHFYLLLSSASTSLTSTCFKRQVCIQIPRKWGLMIFFVLE